jgi:peptidoglycan/LPS O-acetylase OafA/YrhL
LAAVDSPFPPAAMFGTAPTEAAEPTFRPDIEGLRGIAILFVVAYHAGIPGFAGGYIGVDVFFVLSGYLITTLLTLEVEKTGTVDLVRFYARRARRLLPAATLVLFATLVAGSIVYAPLERSELSRAAIATAVYVSNLAFARAATDYLAASAHDNPLLHTWSLSVEEQFYVFWPLFVVWAMRRRAGPASRGRLVAHMAALAVVSFGVSLWVTSAAQPWAFFGMPTRAWEFACGGLAAVGRVPTGLRRRVAPGLTAWAGAGAVALSVLAYSDTTTFPGFAALAPALGTALVLGAGAGAPGSRLQQAIRRPVLQWFGKVSYSWYLWHWPVLVFGAVLLDGIALPGRLVSVIIALVLAALTHRLIENPIRHSTALAARAGLSVGLALGLTLLAAGVSTTWRQLARRGSLAGPQRLFAAASSDIPRVYDNGCHVQRYSDTNANGCAFGDTTSHTVVVLFGDSHAAQWFPAMEALAIKHRWKLLLFTKSACPAVSVTVFNTALARPYVECDRWRDKTLRSILSLRPAAVVLSSSTHYVGALTPSQEHAVDPTTWATGAHVTLSRLDSLGAPIVVLRDTPRPGFRVPRCLARAAWQGDSNDRQCAVRRLSALDTTVYRIERGATASLRNVVSTDLTWAICDTALCAPKRHGLIVYRDDDHLTATFSAALADALGRELEQVMASTRAPGRSRRAPHGSS